MLLCLPYFVTNSVASPLYLQSPHVYFVLPQNLWLAATEKLTNEEASSEASSVSRQKGR